jgi:eukaryotic-like serine/threonine-protein kinase
MPHADSQATSSGTSVAVSPHVDTEVGKVVVDMGLATRTEVDFCREQQKQASDPSQRSLVDMLVEHMFITVNQAKRIRSVVNERRGSRIPGYHILERLGKGAMATVYKAKQEALDRIVAIKVLPPKMNENQEFVERFYREGRAAARLAHNNIVQAYDVGQAPDGFHYFVMEYIEGKTLYDLMQPPPLGEGHAFSEREALDIMIQITDACVHAHERGLIHRDIKPKNIILTPQSIAKLTDLGLARATDDKAVAAFEAGKAYGTPYYISPEQIRGEVDIDFRADIYSLGATMYHLVTGRTPFEADSPTLVMHKHLREPLVPPDHINTALSTGISEIIEVAMAKRREERYASTRDMLEDLIAVRNGEAPLHARRTVDLESLAKVEETGKTVDLAPPGPPAPLWAQPKWVTWYFVGLGASVFLNLIMLIVLLRMLRV